MKFFLPKKLNFYSDKNCMQCVILAAGRGTRMGSLCDDCPKPMLPINGKPKLAYTVEALPEEITEVILIVGYLKERIIDFFGKEYAGKKMRYVVYEAVDGTGKVLYGARDVLEERFLVINGDDLYRKEDLRKLLECDLGVLSIELSDARNYAVLKTDLSGNLESIVEVPHASPSKLVNAGAYRLTRNYFEYPLVPKAPGSSEYGLPQTLMQMRDAYAIAVVRAKDWFPIGTPEEWRKAQKRIFDFQ